MEKKIINFMVKAFEIKDKKEILAIKSKGLKIKQLKNFDSLNYLKFLSLIEKELRIKINQKNFSKISNLDSIIKLIDK